MAARGDHAFICTVVFIDIVEYSKKSVTDQMQIKERFNALLARSLADVPNNDRIILDTGDGAAINFLGDPEEGLYLGLALRDALNAPGNDTLRLRTGINLGPVRLVKDINGQPNVIGDGINVAQRVMSFADINQVLASRSYYEVVSALSADYAHLFNFEGARTDKHVREHEVYALGKAPAPPRAPRARRGPAAAHAAAAMHKLGTTANLARTQIMRRPPLATGLAVALILVTAVAVRIAVKGAEAEAARQAEIAASQVVMPRPLPAKTPAVQAQRPAPVAEAEPAPKPRPAKKPPRPAAEAAATGTLRLNVLPWGEIHINGNQYGVSPPLRDIALKPGVYKLEIRNPGFASYLQVVEVTPGEEIKIRHRFR